MGYRRQKKLQATATLEIFLGTYINQLVQMVIRSNSCYYHLNDNQLLKIPS